MKLRFSIRDLLWLTVVFALAFTIYLERRRPTELQEYQNKRISELLDQVKYLRESVDYVVRQRDGIPRREEGENLLDIVIRRRDEKGEEIIIPTR